MTDFLQRESWDETVCSAAHLSLNKCRTFHRQHILIYSTICQKWKNRCWQFEQNFEVWELSDVLCTAAPLMQFKCSLCHKSANVNITTSLFISRKKYPINKISNKYPWYKLWRVMPATRMRLCGYRSAMQCIYFIYGLIHFLLIPAVASRDCVQWTEMGQFPLYTQYFAEMAGTIICENVFSTTIKTFLKSKAIYNSQKRFICIFQTWFRARNI